MTGRLAHRVVRYRCLVSVAAGLHLNTPFRLLPLFKDRNGNAGKFGSR